MYVYNHVHVHDIVRRTIRRILSLYVLELKSLPNLEAYGTRIHKLTKYLDPGISLLVIRALPRDCHIGHASQHHAIGRSGGVSKLTY